MDPVTQSGDIAPSPLLLRQLGLEDYRPVWQRMQAFTDARDGATQDELWLVEHPSVFTLGQAGRMEHVLDPGAIPVVQVDRGGQVTYHGPGQMVAYPLLDLTRLRLGVKTLVERLEEAVIRVLAGYGIDAARRPGAPGVYVGEEKIASLGLRVRRGCSFHGLALNVAMDLAPFERINPCGYQGQQLTQVADLGGPADLARVAADFAATFAPLIGTRLDREHRRAESTMSAEAARG